MLIHKHVPISLFLFEQIEAIYFSGFNKKDVAWFHKPSKSLIVADLIFNLPGEEQYSKSRRRKSGLLTKNLNPYTYFHKNFIMGETNDREYGFRTAVRALAFIYSPRFSSVPWLKTPRLLPHGILNALSLATE